MYYGCKWEVLSGVCTILLAAFVVVIPLQQDAYWWRIIVGLLTFAAIFGPSSRPEVRTHPASTRASRTCTRVHLRFK